MPVKGADDVYCRTAAVDPIVRAPGLSIPIGLTTDGMPIGLQLQARPGVLPSHLKSRLSLGGTCASLHPQLPLLHRQQATSYGMLSGMA